MAATLTLAPKPLNFSKDPTWVEFETSLISGLGEPDEPNLSLYAQIWQKRNTIDYFLTEINLTYSRITAKTEMDLANITDVEPEAPTDESISGFAFGFLPKPAVQLYLRFDDMYGDPVEFPSTLTNSANYWVISGGTPYFFGIGNDAPTAFMMHGYFDKKGKFVIKQTRKDQPEYAYIFAPESTTINVKVQLVYTDGADTMHDIESASLDTGVSFITIGWNQLGLSTHLNPDKTLGFYRVILDGLPGNKSIFYQLDDHDTEYDEYFLFDNGLGGCEVVRCSGRHQEDFEASKNIIKKPRIRGYQSRDGLTGHTNTSGASVWKMNTGFIPESYARHLRQLPLADVWYIDKNRGKFEKVTIKETNMKLVDRNEDLQSLEFTVVFDTRESANNFNI